MVKILLFRNVSLSVPKYIWSCINYTIGDAIARENL